MEFLYAYLLLGIFSGILAGLLGVGGGLIIVPALAYLFASEGFFPGIIMHMAIGTSLLTIVTTAISSIYAHHRYGNIQWDLVKQLTPGLLIGALLGAAIADQMDTGWLKTLFGLFAILVSLQIAFGMLPASQHQTHRRSIMHLAGGGIGVISSLVGIGGGSLSVPFLVWCNVVMKKAVATSAACGLPIAVSGAIGFIITGWNTPNLPAYSSGFVYWPAAVGIMLTSILFAPAGAKLAQHLPVKQLKRIFAVFLLIVGLQMLVG